MKEMSWLHKIIQIILIISIPVSCYFPVFLLVRQSSDLFKPSNLPSTSSSSSPISNPPVATPSPTVTSSSGSSRINQSKSTSPELSVYTELIKVSVESEVRKQSEEAAKNAAKDEVEKLKAEYKGDVFVQIVFPVLFAIASIFAAFAVKDIITKILDQQEQDRIKTELETTLKNQIAPKAAAEANQDITDRLDDIEAYAHWLEHQILSILITQAIDELKEYSISLENEPKLLSAIQKLGDRSIITLEKASGNFRRKYFDNIKKIEKDVLQSKLSNINLSADKQEVILSIFNRHSKNVIEQEVYQGQNLFQTQMGLLRIVLNRSLTDNEGSIELVNLLNELDENISKDPREEHKINSEIIAKREQERHSKPRKWY